MRLKCQILIEPCINGTHKLIVPSYFYACLLSNDGVIIHCHIGRWITLGLFFPKFM